MESCVKFRLICDPGLEDVSVREAAVLLGRDSAALLAESPLPRSGIAVISCTPEEAGLLQKMRTAYYIVRDLGGITAAPAEMSDALCSWAATAKIPGLSAADSFRVSCERHGGHPFSSPEISRRVGAVLDNRSSARVDLEAPDVNIRLDIRDTRARMGITLHEQPLDKRYRWRFRPRVTLRTTAAAAMLQLACECLAETDQLRICDPFCGSGTILLEAAAMFPSAILAGSDIDPEATAGTLENAIAAGSGPRIDVRIRDALQLPEYCEPASVDILVTNPPFGLRLGKRLDFRHFYRQLLDAAAFVVRPGGCLVLLVGKKRGLFNSMLQESPHWQERDARVIDLGGSFPGLFTLQRTAVSAVAVR